MTCSDVISRWVAAGRPESLIDGRCIQAMTIQEGSAVVAGIVTAVLLVSLLVGSFLIRQWMVEGG